MADDSAESTWEGLALDTVAAHAGRPPRRPGAPLNVPLVAASTFHAGGRIDYGRSGNEGVEAFEEAVAALERAPGSVAFSSGMAAIAGVLDRLPQGSVVTAPAGIYFEVAQSLRVRADSGALVLRTVSDPSDADALVEAARTSDVVWLESPTNPLLDPVDIAAVARQMRADALLVVDNTLATPVLARPLGLGAHVVLHSATKQIAGHSDAVIGVVSAKDVEWLERLRDERGDRGALPGALETFLALRGLRTLPLRVLRAQATARVLAERLDRHPCVTRVRWPGWGTLLSIEVAGTGEDADRVCSSARLWTSATSLGDVTSLIERRRRWPTESESVPETLLRLSVGIEDADDLWRDLDRALRSGVS